MQLFIIYAHIIYYEGDTKKKQTKKTTFLRLTAPIMPSTRSPFAKLAAMEKKRKLAVKDLNVCM